MRKRIFVLGHWMRIDGVSTSLLGLLKELDYSKVDVDLMLMSAEGELLGELPRQVNLLPTHPDIANYWGNRSKRTRRRLIAQMLKKASLLVSGIWYRIFRRMKIDPYGMGLVKGFLFDLVIPGRIVPKEYDIALFFSCEPFLVGHVMARRSAVWVHTDWGYFHPIKWLMNLGFGRADYIVNVSLNAKMSFDKYLTKENLTKSIVIENCLSPKWIEEQADSAEVLIKSSGLRILSVGRVAPPKNYFRALNAARILMSRGVDFIWVVVGGGESFGALESAAAKADIGDRFKLVGAVDNPYPYYKWADMFVCTSDWEGKSVSVREAQMFALPTVITRYPTSASQLEDGVDGIIVELTAEAVADGIVRLMKNVALRERLSVNCRCRDYANLGEIDKILAL